MQIAMVGLGRMGANMTRRLLRGGHECVVFNRSPQPVQALVREGALGATDLKDLVNKLVSPRAIWLMVPAAAVDDTISQLVPDLEAGDTLIDGGNSYYVDDIRRAKELAAKTIHYVDVGTSGGVWGLERGYCMMIGGESEVVKRLDPIFSQLAPGVGNEISRALRDSGLPELNSKHSRSGTVHRTSPYSIRTMWRCPPPACSDKDPWWSASFEDTGDPTATWSWRLYRKSIPKCEHWVRRSWCSLLNSNGIRAHCTRN
jgi:6-phosphogluconate dehydrogenase (decarboxylating)